MSVPEQTPYIEHTGNGVTTSFALKFQCESKDHLIVLVDDVEPPIASWSLTGGNVVFTTAPASGRKITLQRNTPFSRNTDYQSYNNSFRPPAVNKDFDWIWWKLQELGVADWILGNRISALKNYVDRKDDELKAYLMEEIRKQGVALDQLDEYYNYLMERLAQIAVDKGWDASFVVDGDKNQKQINAEINIKSKRDNETIYDYGAIGDGILHTVQEWYTAGSNNYNQKYKGLADVQADYSFVTDKDFSIDQAAILKLANIKSNKGGGCVDLSQGHFIVKPVNNGACLSIPPKVTLVGHYEDTVLEEISNSIDDPTTSVWWDLILFSGNTNVGGGVKNCTFRHTGGKRNNTATVAVRSGASRKKISGCIFENTIGTCIGIEYDSYSPKPLNCRVFENTFTSTSRHCVYIIGSTHNYIYNNTFYINALEAIVFRAANDCDVVSNNFFGVEGVKYHAITLAAPPTGVTYKYERLKISNNKMYGLKGAAFYGQGVGCTLYDSEIINNTFNLDNVDNEFHSIMLYRANRCKVSLNIFDGGRNRAIYLYGSSKNEINSNTIKNVISSGSTQVGAIGLASYKDSDNITYYSTDNKLVGNNIVDDRSIPLMKTGVQMGAGCIRNLVSKTEFEGIQTKIDSVDGLSNQYVGETINKLLFGSPSMTAGTNTSTDMSFVGNTLLAYVNREVFIKSFRLVVQQLTISGTATARLYKNGSALVANVFTADNSSKTGIIHYQPGQYSLNSGDTINLKIETASLTTEQSSLSFAVEIELAQ
ncbi:hypothetical protein AY605_07395 [Acinetobacter sp. SFD]|uniref:right-handed parallel beta-helix repeat-containing protein n=1 Tax=Acinetobacter sp. SFD TaxID=1805635 RepID=UPI0007D04878|nr:right-handed parallel beta-helix repeat-containing protein [Acinetobacter sp. SFD]OAL84478.1 hypothetical protein AY605_07395 [Acinetobacter sp. SFD]